MRPEQQRINEWLRERAPQLAAVYEGAIRLLGDVSFPGRQHFICHAARDIGNRVPDLLAGRISKRAENSEHLDTLVALWAENALDRIDLGEIPEGAEKSPSLAGGSISVPRQVFKQVQIVVGLHRQGTENHRERAMRMVEAIDPRNIGRQEHLFPLAKQWTELTRWFHSQAHAGLAAKVVDEETLQSKFSALEAYLSAIIGEFYEPVDTLDEILEDTNS